ncbi:hypothetical protein [Chryseobacterium daecheongense]|uniref:hypothetical protein n=1 Tax=Chryseobacterium daecheongense TaxID=192389 RepID=UPI00374D3150
MYSHVSKKHLQKYVDEFVYRFNLRKVSHQENSDICYLIQMSELNTKSYVSNKIKKKGVKNVIVDDIEYFDEISCRKQCRFTIEIKS